MIQHMALVCQMLYKGMSLVGLLLVVKEKKSERISFRNVVPTQIQKSGDRNITTFFTGGLDRSWRSCQQFQALSGEVYWTNF